MAPPRQQLPAPVQPVAQSLPVRSLPGQSLPAQPPAARRASRAVARWGWLGAGFAAVAVGSVAVVVPGLPTTVFFVFAAWCFSRSSPRFEAWVLGLPKVGRLVADYRAGLGMPRRAKGTAVAMMWIAVGLSAYINRDRQLLAAVIAACGVAGTAAIVWRVPTRADDLA